MRPPPHAPIKRRLPVAAGEASPIVSPRGLGAVAPRWVCTPKPAQAIVVRELRRWHSHRGWQFVDRRLLLAILLFGVCPTLGLFFIFPLFPVFAFATQLLLSVLLYGLATQRAAMFIAEECELHTWDLLQISALSPAAILTGKLLALFEHTREALLTVAGLRAFTFGMGLMALFAFAPQWAFLGNSAGQATQYLALLVAAGALWSLWLYVDTLYSSAVGVLASSMTTSAGTAWQLALGLHAAFVLGLLLPIIQLGLAASRPILNTGAPPFVRLLLWIGFPLALAALARLAITATCLWWAVRRADSAAL